jgi:hypothetical protein
VADTHREASEPRDQNLDRGTTCPEVGVAGRKWERLGSARIGRGRKEIEVRRRDPDARGEGPHGLGERSKRIRKEWGLLSYPTGGLSRSGWRHMSGAGWGRALWRCPCCTCSIDKYRILVASAICSNMKPFPAFSLLL